MTPSCAGCGAALGDPPPRLCSVCGLRVGVLPANVQELRAQERQRRAGRQARATLRPVLLVLVLGMMLALAFGAGAEAAPPGAQPVLGLVGRTVQMLAQAAETQIARRSRMPGPGDPQSDQWKQSGAGQLLILVVVAGGLLLLVRSRVR